MIGHQNKSIKRLFNKKLTQDQRQKQVMNCSQVFLNLATTKLVKTRHLQLLILSRKLKVQSLKLNEMNKLDCLLHLEDLIEHYHVPLYPLACE